MLKKEISFIYHYELARLGSQNMRNDTAILTHLKEAYALHPQNANLQGLILYDLGRKAEKSNEANVIMALLMQYEKAFGFLLENARHNTVKANCLLELAYQSFTINSIAKGDNYLADFEKLYRAVKGIEPSGAFVEKAYSVPAGIYYKKGNVAKARQYLKTGLVYAPDSFGLKQRLSQL